MQQTKINAVIKKLQEMGYENVEYHSIVDAFDFRYANKASKKAKLEYVSGQFVVSTVSSHWTTAEAQEFLLQLQTVTQQAIELNKLLQQ